MLYMTINLNTTHYNIGIVRLVIWQDLKIILKRVLFGGVVSYFLDGPQTIVLLQCI